MAAEELEEKQFQEEVKEEDDGEYREETGEGRKEMKPWEQHASVISIPRYDYAAPSSILQHSSSGFLITCPIKREKSATKEAIAILEKFISSHIAASLKDSVADEVVKKRKLCCTDGKSVETVKSGSEAAGVYSDKSAAFHGEKPTLSLLKLTRSGLLLFTLHKDSFVDPVGVVSDVYQSSESGALKHLLWCHRIFPIQATSILNEKEVGATVSNLVLQFVNDKRNNLSKPVKFAVGFNRRGLEETRAAKDSKNNCDTPDSIALLDRNKCFAIVAAAVKDVVSDSVVDLKSPEISILIELLPISGVPNGSLVTAVSVLPKDLVNTKPRLCIKALVSETKARNGVH